VGRAEEILAQRVSREAEESGAESARMKAEIFSVLLPTLRERTRIFLELMEALEYPYYKTFIAVDDDKYIAWELATYNLDQDLSSGYGNLWLLSSGEIVYQSLFPLGASQRLGQGEYLRYYQAIDDYIQEGVDRGDQYANHHHRALQSALKVLDDMLKPLINPTSR